MDTGTQLPARIGPYEVLAPVGTGAFSRVVKCRHVDTGRIAAVKLPGGSLEHRARLKHEARILSRLGKSRHPGVIELLETGTDQGVPWTALRFVDGSDLASRYPTKRRGRLDMDLAEIARLGRRIADALAHTHGHGVIHCDLSPRNILLENGNQPVLIDFNSALVPFDGSAMREVMQPPATFHGTPGYAAPEQLMGLSVDARSDLYALGCILYELIAGVPPFRADSIEALCQQHLHLSPSALSSRMPSVPHELDLLILTLLQKNPKARIDRAEEVMRKLEHLSARVDRRTATGAQRWNLHRPQLVGRETALQSLVTRLHATVQGRGGFSLVSGTSGIGKTRLLNELAHRARGFTVLFGRCTPVAGSRERMSAGQALQPFLPFLEWLTTFLQVSDTPISAELAIALGVLSGYEPSLEAHAPRAVPSLPPELGRSRVLQSLIEALLAASAESPLLLMIDDLQWGDDLTHAFFREDYRALLDSSRVLIVAAHRSEDAEPATLGHDVERIALNPLSGDELGVMATDMLGTELVPAGLAEALHHHSEGNPFFAAEYLRAFIECGLLSRRGERDWELSDRGAERPGVSVPASLRDLFALRIQGLTDVAKETLELSALLGRQFSASLVMAIVQETHSDAAIDGALGELVKRGILESLTTDQYRFVHDKLREAQAHAIPDARRRDLHRSIALLLMAHSQDLDSQVSQAEVGLHWAEAGDPIKAVPHLKAAAEQAASRYMNADAVELYTLALSQIDVAMDQVAERRSEWLTHAVSLGEARGDVLAWSARHHEARAQHHATLALVPSQDRLCKARLERKTAKAYWTVHDYDNALTALQRAADWIGDIEQLSKAENVREWIEIQQGFFWLRYFAKAGPTEEALMRRMESIVEQHGTPAQKSMFYECAVGDILARESYRYSERAAALARRSESEVSSIPEQLAQTADARFSLAFVLTQGNTEQCREAASLLEANLRVLTPIGEATLLTRSLVYLAIVWRRLGDKDSTQRFATLARRSAQRIRMLPYIGASVACEAWVHWRNGNAIEAQRHADEACAWWTKAPHAFPFQWLATFILLDLHYVKDDFVAARRVISDLLDTRQQRFSEELDTSMVRCKEVLERNEEQRHSSLALRSVLELARRHSYL